MFEFLRDQFATARLRARYQRIVQERLLELTERNAFNFVADEPGDWLLLGGTKGAVSEQERTSVRDRARKLVRENPHACNIFRLLEAYVTGPGLQLSHQQRHAKIGETSQPLVETADRLWAEFLRHNCWHYSFREHARRAWRDGECFVRKFSGDFWPPSMRFIDPELISGGTEAPHSQGIITDPHDVEQPRE